MFNTLKIAKKDPLSERLERFAQNILVFVFGLLPLFFIPVAAAPFGYTKAFFVLGGIVLALIFYTLSVLREGQISIGFPFALVGLWGVALVTFVSAILSGDFKDGLVGDFFSVHSAAFVGTLALGASMWALLNVKKNAILRLYTLLATSALLLALFHFIRLIAGPEVLEFSVFLNATNSPVGGWNDLAIFLGLALLLVLVTIEQLPLTTIGKTLFLFVGAVALLMLGIINFIYVWIVLAVVSLATLIYTVSKKGIESVQSTLLKGGAQTSAVIPALVLCIVSIAFIAGGSFLGGKIADTTGVIYTEVRPSFEATAGIARNVYAGSMLLGTGPNSFADDWRLYKDPAINATFFWNTDFVAGNGYIPTFFVTTGVLGGIAWGVFLVLFVITGIYLLTRAPKTDHMWYYIGVSSFVSATYIWTMAIVYVPGHAILLLGSLCTGVLFASVHALQPERIRVFTVGTSKRAGFVFTLCAVAVIVGSVSLLYTTSRHYAAAYTYNTSFTLPAAERSLDTLEKIALDAYALSPSDTYLRAYAEYQLLRLNRLIGISNPSEAQLKEFETYIARGVQRAQEATRLDGEEPANWNMLGQLYSILVSAGVGDYFKPAKDALTTARILDPKNPRRSLALAELEVRGGNYIAARGFIEEAIRLKSDYSDAYFLLAQIEVADGNIAAALKSARAVTALEPNNPARFYQLGILEMLEQNNAAATAAFERAVQLDPNYSNARYFLALMYDTAGRSTDVRVQLERVLELNPGNENVSNLLAALEKNGTLGVTPIERATEQVVVDEGQVREKATTGDVLDDPNSPLVNPVNILPDTDGNAATEIRTTTQTQSAGDARASDGATTSDESEVINE